MTAGIPLEHGLIIAAGLFVIGLIGVLVRRSLLFQLLSIEIMLNAAGMAFVIAGARWARRTAKFSLSSSWSWRPRRSPSDSRSCYGCRTGSGTSTATR